jgi:hypothetical protein
VPAVQIPWLAPAGGGCEFVLLVLSLALFSALSSFRSPAVLIAQTDQSRQRFGAGI